MPKTKDRNKYCSACHKWVTKVHKCPHGQPAKPVASTTGTGTGAAKK